ncbi:MAG TPA: hypothetical protein PLD19_12360 [Luteimonas sp.]|nr:hypothetical protein [Luteimonas sp.]
MSEMSPDSARIDVDDARLEVTFAALTPETVRVRYRLRNSGDVPLAVFDRGDRHAVLMKRQAAGAVGAPTFEEAVGGDVVLRHVARPLAGGPTGPTLPPTPRALKLAPGASVEGGFSFAMPASSPPRRVRWCLGVAPFDDAAFFSPETVDAGEIWQAGEDAVRAQRSLCTPWFDLAAGAFAAG